MKDQFIGMNIKQSENKITVNEYRYFLESKFVGVNRLFVSVYSSQDKFSKRFKAKRYYLPKGIIDSCNIIINGKISYDQTIDSGMHSLLHGSKYNMTNIFRVSHILLTYFTSL